MHWILEKFGNELNFGITFLEALSPLWRGVKIFNFNFSKLLSDNLSSYSNRLMLPKTFHDPRLI